MAYKELHNFSDLHSKRELHFFLSGLEGEHWVRVTKAKKQHTQPQQKYYWAVIAPQVAACMSSAEGEKFDKAAGHEVMKVKFLRVPVTHPETGEQIAWFVRSSSSLDAAEYSAFIESVIGWLWHTFRVAVPPPSHFDIQPKQAATAAGK